MVMNKNSGDVSSNILLKKVSKANMAKITLHEFVIQNFYTSGCSQQWLLAEHKLDNTDHLGKHLNVLS
jgi:hypothetical protein